MATPARAEIERLVMTTVSRQLNLGTSDLASMTDLRTLRAFSSFAAVDILEDLENGLQVEVPADHLSAEHLCSVAALTELFMHALIKREVTQ